MLFSLQTKFFVTENTVDMMMTEIAEQDPWVREIQQRLCVSSQLAIFFLAG